MNVKTSEMNYAYDPDGNFENNNFIVNTYNIETNLCGDGSSNCIYQEVYTSERMLIDIVNIKGEKLVDKIRNDVFSGRINFKDENMLKSFNITNKMLHFNDSPIIPGYKITDENQMYPGLVVFYIFLYYKTKGLKMPYIKYRFKMDIPYYKQLVDGYLTALFIDGVGEDRVYAQGDILDPTKALPTFLNYMTGSGGPLEEKWTQSRSITLDDFIEGYYKLLEPN